MFLSVIVPCYNAGPYIGRLLDSIYAQHFKEVEVIICDDCSTEPYDEIVHNYEDRLNIVRTKTSINGGPSAAKEEGCKIATGEWIMFADCDDYFVGGAFQKIAAYLRKHPSALYLYTEFDEVTESGKIIRHFKDPFGWTHGKVFSRAFWERNNIHFPPIRTHEDIYISTVLGCALQNEGRGMDYCAALTYKWVQHDKSMTHSGDRSFLEIHLEDYIKSTGDPYLDFFENAKAETGKEYGKYHAAGVLLYLYFYHMGIIFRNVNGFLRENTVLIKDFFERFKKATGMTNDEIMVYMAQDDCQFYWRTMENACMATGPFIPCLTIQDYLNLMVPEVMEDGEEHEG